MKQKTAENPLQATSYFHSLSHLKHEHTFWLECRTERKLKTLAMCFFYRKERLAC